jgi:hypothetical protein
MKLSKFTTLIMIFIFFLIIYYSIQIIVYYYNANGLIYVNIYGMYYIFFFFILLISISFKYYISVVEIPPEYMTNGNLLGEKGCTADNCVKK